MPELAAGQEHAAQQTGLSEEGLAAQAYVGDQLPQQASIDTASASPAVVRSIPACPTASLPQQSVPAEHISMAAGTPQQVVPAEAAPTEAAEGQPACLNALLYPAHDITETGLAACSEQPMDEQASVPAAKPLEASPVSQMHLATVSSVQPVAEQISVRIAQAVNHQTAAAQAELATSLPAFDHQTSIGSLPAAVLPADNGPSSTAAAKDGAWIVDNPMFEFASMVDDGEAGSDEVQTSAAAKSASQQKVSSGSPQPDVCMSAVYVTGTQTA